MVLAETPEIPPSWLQLSAVWRVVAAIRKSSYSIAPGASPPPRHWSAWHCIPGEAFQALSLKSWHPIDPVKLNNRTNLETTEAKRRQVDLSPNFAVSSRGEDSGAISPPSHYRGTKHSPVQAWVQGSIAPPQISTPLPLSSIE